MKIRLTTTRRIHNYLLQNPGASYRTVAKAVRIPCDRAAAFLKVMFDANKTYRAGKWGSFRWFAVKRPSTPFRAQVA